MTYYPWSAESIRAEGERIRRAREADPLGFARRDMWFGLAQLAIALLVFVGVVVLA